MSKVFHPGISFTLSSRWLDFENFQALLLGKHIKCSVDTKEISSTDGVEQCHRENIRILFDPQKRTKHILYFKKATKEGITEYMEWPGMNPLSNIRCAILIS
jgi:hypothetical protein